MSVAISQFIPSPPNPPLSPLGVHTFVLYICVSISALQIIAHYFTIPRRLTQLRDRKVNFKYSSRDMYMMYITGAQKRNVYVQGYMCLLNIWHGPLGLTQTTPEGLTLGMRSRKKMQTVESIKTKASSFVFESAFQLWLQPQSLAKYLQPFLTLLRLWWPMTILSHKYLHS